jgi:2-C-methyl-D-erythritol 4-phosphate cytidylyltransferase
VFTLRRLAACPLISNFLIATHADEIGPLNQRIAAEHLSRPVRVLPGGDTRQESVAKALAEVPRETEFVLVHDAVRPLVTRDQVERVIAEAQRCRAAILGIPAMDTVKEVKRASLPEDVALITATIPRERIVLAQTPQVFEAALFREAFSRAAADGFTASDESALVERLGHNVHVVLGSERNLKITKPGDLEIAEFYLSRERMAAEVGR